MEFFLLLCFAEYVSGNVFVVFIVLNLHGASLYLQECAVP